MRNAHIIYRVLFRIAFGLAIAFLLNQFAFDYLEAIFYDARVRFEKARPTSGHIETVAIEPLTILRLGHIPNALDHKRLLEQIYRGQPKAVVYVLNPSELVGSKDELKQLADIMASAQNFYALIQDTPLKGEERSLHLPAPFDKVRSASGPKTLDGNIFAGDNVTRRMFLSYQGLPSLHPLVAALFNPSVRDESKIQGAFSYLGSKQVYIDIRPSGTYPRSEFSELEGATPEDLTKFRNKIVLVGRDIQTSAKDYVRTPLSRDIVAMTFLELNANMLDTLILNSAPIRPPAWLELIVTSLISILTVYVVLTLKPTQGLLLLGTTLATYFIVCFLFFWLKRLWIDMAHPFLAVFICYYFFIPYRLIIENRRSWEYYQKNRLLTQVEELKTNFLSMMSHDLKTPIARIQGMTDIVLKDPHPLSSRQSEALQTLARSSEELLLFVSSILNLGRIESKEIKLHMQSRDPNQLIQGIIEKYEFMARAKGISINAELEPIFSVKMDADLIGQVLSNLIENAIKYSHENSRILVTTEELDGHIVIQIADQGRGIEEDELPNVFMKFYRSKNAKGSTIKGSGLGLYLAKYFVELHKGTISVDSRPGLGSTFTVSLPMNDRS